MDESTSSKTCVRCGALKPLTEFNRRASSPDGRVPRCKPCRSADTAAYREREREVINAKQREFKRANPDKVKASRKKFALDHPEKKREWDRRYREMYAAEVRLRKATYSAKNADRIRAAAKAWRQANPIRYRELQQRRRSRVRGATVEPVDVLALWTGTCGICALPIDIDLAWPDSMSKSIDHIVPLCVGGSHSQDNLQWTHLVCNLRKGQRAP